MSPARPVCLPTPAEMADAGRWVAAHLRRPAAPARKAAPVAPSAGLTVLANHGPVQLNARGGAPLRIGGVDYGHGLYCHAPSKVVVRLPGPGERLTARIGIDDHANGGTVVFGVRVDGVRAYRSGTVTCGKPAEAIDVPLSGASEFTLEAGDAGDGISCDQANWAEAVATLADGRGVRLGDLPVASEAPRTRTVYGLPFSFTYGGVPSDELLPTWQFATATSKLSGGRTQRTLTFTEPGPGLEAVCTAVTYRDYPVVEWTLAFRNRSGTRSPIIEGVRSLDVRLERPGKGPLELRRWLGSICAANDYEPIVEPMAPGASRHVATQGGRPTNSDMPYFSLAWPGGGALAVIGWAGQWSADFMRDASGRLRVCGGQERTRFAMEPGEALRSAMGVLLFHRGDPERAQNLWRRWMVAHNLPRPDGKPIKPMLSACNGNHYPGIISNGTEEQRFLNGYLEQGVRPEFWWQDAGWYPCDPDGWPKVGTWEVEPSRWPQGIRGVSDWARQRGIRTIVWFEPERVAAGTWLAEQRPQWVIGGKAGGLLRLGDPECRSWLAQHIDKLMTDQGIDLYRQDFNIDPLSYWQSDDADDRQGVAEMRHVAGYLAYWDDLQRRRPGMLIDSCASGGRRNDLETLRRAVPLLRSDYTFEPVGEQCHTYGVASWIPFHGTGFLTCDKYLIRSQMSPEFTMGIDTRRKDQDYDLLRKMVAEWRRVGPCQLGDYWPLTPYSKANDAWMAWQFDLPEEGRGVVQAFRRADCPTESLRVKLRGLDPAATYTVEEMDRGAVRTLTGRMLMEEGLELRATERPAAVTLCYTSKKPEGGR